MNESVYSPESLHDIIRSTAIEVLGLSNEVASSFAHIAASKVTGFFLRFDNIPGNLILKNVIYDGGRFIVEWESVSTKSNCPMCGKTSERELSKHLFYEMVQDVCISGIALWHKIYRKKYICTNDHCIQKNFMEGFPGFVEGRWARMTVRFAEYVMETAINTSSRAAEKILQGQGAEISRDTVIRVMLRRGAKQIERNLYDNADKVVNVGIDDINLRKGDSSTSCMVIVDIDTRKLLGIVRGTTGDTAERVLGMFPNLKIVSRDRGTAMASAAQALNKESVADRFHITDNMHDVIKRTLHETLPALMYIPIGDSWVYMSNDSENGELVVAGMPASLTEKDIRQRIRMARLGVKAELTYRNTLRVLELTLQGKHAEEMSDIMGIPVETVRKLRSGMRETISGVEKKLDEFVASPHGSAKRQKSVTKSAQHSSKSKVEPYRDTVIAMWKEGKGHRLIYDEICKHGFKGSHSTVDNYIIKLEREDSIDTDMITRSISNDYFGSIPERPERISVCIYSPKTIYNMVLEKIREYRRAIADKKHVPDNELSDQTSGQSPDQVSDQTTDQTLDQALDQALDQTGMASDQAPKKGKKNSAVPSRNRMNIPLELVDILNWKNTVPIEKEQLIIETNREMSVEHYMSVMHPVYDHMIQFGIDYHNFMDNNDLDGLLEFINKYKNDSYWRLARFANGLQMDIEAVKNTLLHPKISNGVVEGINNAIKCDKRVCGGRAKIDLLTAKMVLRHLDKESSGIGNTA